MHNCTLTALNLDSNIKTAYDAYSVCHRLYRQYQSLLWTDTGKPPHPKNFFFCKAIIQLPAYDSAFHKVVWQNRLIVTENSTK